jgi:branched-chain amino acid transport system substrate-binding protein
MSDPSPPPGPVAPIGPDRSNRRWVIVSAAFCALLLLAAVAIALFVRITYHKPTATASRSGAGSPSASNSPTPAAPPTPPAPAPAVALPTGAPVCGAHLGYLGPLSDAAGDFGTSIKQGAQLAVDRYNAEHLGCEVSLVPLDSQGDPDRASAQAQQAVDDRLMLGVIGPVLAGETEAALPVLNRASLATITPSASQSTLSTHGWRVFHRAIPSDGAQGPAAAHYITDALHANKVFVIDDGSSYGVAMTGGVRAALGRAVVGTDRVRAGRSFAGTVTKVKASGATVVYYGGFYDTAGALLNQMRTAGVTATLVGGDGMHDATLSTSAGGQSLNGTVITNLVAPASDPGFVAGYRGAYQTGPGDYSGTAYDVANIFLLGLGHGVGTRADMLNFVNTYAGSGVAGTYRFTPVGDLDPGGAKVAILVYQHGWFLYQTSEPAQ